MKQPVLALVLACAFALAPLSGCSTEQLNSPAGQAAALSATNIAGDVLNAWIASHPFSAKRHSQALTLKSPAVVQSMEEAKAKVREKHPKIPPDQVDKIVRDKYAEKFRDG